MIRGETWDIPKAMFWREVIKVCKTVLNSNTCHRIFMLCWNITVPQTRRKSGGSVMINLCNILRAGEKRLKWANYSGSAYSLYWHERERVRMFGRSQRPLFARCLSSSSSTSPSAHYSAQAFTLRLMNITSTSSTKSSLSKSHHNHPKMKSAHQTHTTFQRRWWRRWNSTGIAWS